MSRIAARSALLLLAIGCGGGIGAKTTDPDDLDGDGYPAEEDCDDDNAAVNPGATEVCNGVDDDCDGLLDTVDDSLADGVELYADEDGDGYGDPDKLILTCSPGEDAVEDNTDCDDDNSSTHPGATEVCNTSADDDCDGDTNDEGAEGCIDLFEDADGDGFGGVGSACLCDPNDAYPSYFSQDCDDGDADVNPDAAEVCNDGVDNDCDGGPDECPLAGTIDLEDGDASVTGALAGDLAGAQVLGAGDLNGDGRGDVVVMAPGYDGGLGAVAVVRGGWTGTLDLDSVDGLLVGTSTDATLQWAAAGGDLDGDGRGDLLVGSEVANGGDGVVVSWDDPLGGRQGAGDGFVTLTGPTGAGAGLPGVAGDVDGDAAVDLLVGAPEEGSVFLVTGPLTASAALDTVAHELRGTGASLAVVTGIGDVDGDGLADIGIGAPERSATGRAWLVMGPGTGISAVNDADVIVEGADGEDLLGACIAPVGDLDGDGYAEVVVGAPGVDADGRDIGEAYLLHGPLTASGTGPDLARATLLGEFTGDLAGSSAAGGSDIDQDGVPDLLVGAPGHDQAGSGAGLVYVVYGPASGDVELKFSGASLEARARRDASGTSVALPGDLNGDGFGDILVGSPGNDGVATDAGVADVVFGAGL